MLSAGTLWAQSVGNDGVSIPILGDHWGSSGMGIPYADSMGAGREMTGQGFESLLAHASFSP